MSARTILLIAAVLLLSVGTVFVARAWLDSQRVEVAAAPEPGGVAVAKAGVGYLDVPNQVANACINGDDVSIAGSGENPVAVDGDVFLYARAADRARTHRWRSGILTGAFRCRAAIYAL